MRWPVEPICIRQNSVWGGIFLLRLNTFRVSNHVGFAGYLAIEFGLRPSPPSHIRPEGFPQFRRLVGMERLDRRYPVNLEVTVTDIAAQDRVASGRIVDISQSGVGAELSLRFSAGAIVKVQIGDCALLGHVTYCTEGRSFRTGIEVVRMLMGKSDLSRFNAILSETMPTTPERKFEIYRLSVVRSMPDSDLKDAHIHAIKHTLARLDAERPGELKRPASSSMTRERSPARER